MSEKRWLWQGIEWLRGNGLIADVPAGYPWHQYALTEKGQAHLAGEAK